MKSESVPPVNVTSSPVNSVDGSLNVNVSMAVSPAFRLPRLVVIATVGSFVSIESEGDRTPCRLALPAASKNLPGFTVTVPTPVKLAAGVNFAV